HIIRFLFLHSSASPPALHPFPTRRSSDLAASRQRPRGWTGRRRTTPACWRPSSTRSQCKMRSRGGASRRACSRRCTFARSPSRRSEEHTSELQSRGHLVCRLLLEKKKNES